MTPLLRLMLPAFLLVACGSAVTGTAPGPLLPRPVVLLTTPRLTLAFNDRLTLTASVAETGGFLYVYLIDPAGEVNQLLPNRAGAANDLRVDAGQVVAFPPADARFFVIATAPAGRATLLAFASARALNLAAISAYATADAQFADGRITGLDALSAALKLAADAQPGNLYNETRLSLTITP